MSAATAPLADLIVQRYQRLAARIELATEQAGRSRDSVCLLAVSKRHPVEAIRVLIDQGLSCFGENYLAEAQDKMAVLRAAQLTWHFIGSLQSNKTRAVSQQFDWVQSVDRARLVTRLDGHRPAHLPPLQVLIQVNLAGEPQKAGVAAEGVDALARLISDSDRLTLRGLMMIPPRADDPEDHRALYAQARQLFEKLADRYPEADTLSMGMSDDLEVAIDEGSTMIRVGTDLFGPRS